MGCLINPQPRKTSEVPYHSDAAPGKRFVFVARDLYPSSAVYIAGRKVNSVSPDQPVLD